MKNTDRTQIHIRVKKKKVTQKFCVTSVYRLYRLFYNQDSLLSLKSY